MRFLIVLLFVSSLFARQTDLIPTDKRVDVTKFTYTDYPNKRKTWPISDAKGKVIVIAFLAEGYKACAQSLKELNWLQNHEKDFNILILPIYDVASRQRLDTTIGATGQLQRSLSRAGANSTQIDNATVGDGMFINMPLSFRIFQEFTPNNHINFFPKFEAHPAIFFIDHQGRIASYIWGYKKNEMAKVVQKILDENAENKEKSSRPE